MSLEGAPGRKSKCPDSPDILCCDFCINYDFNGEQTKKHGEVYTGDGYCKKYMIPREPHEDICEEFLCSIHDKESK